MPISIRSGKKRWYLSDVTSPRRNEARRGKFRTARRETAWTASILAEPCISLFPSVSLLSRLINSLEYLQTSERAFGRVIEGDVRPCHRSSFGLTVLLWSVYTIVRRHSYLRPRIPDYIIDIPSFVPTSRLEAPVLGIEVSTRRDHTSSRIRFGE